MINFIKNHFTRGHILAAILLAATIAGLIALNAYAQDITQGHYNIINLLFI